MKYLEAIFKLWCILTVSFMIGYWIYKFNKNEDITLIEYRLVTELDGILLPEMCLCIRDPFLSKSFSNKTGRLEEEKQAYKQYLLGNKSINKVYQDVEYDEATFNAFDYFKSILISWKSRETNFSRICSNINDCPYFIFSNNYNGMISDDFFKCFGVAIKKEFSKEVAHYMLIFRSELRNNIEDATSTLVSFNLPNQFIRNFGGNKPVKWRTDSKRGIDIFEITSVELLKRRNKRNEPCMDQWMSYDKIVEQRHVEDVGCRAPYQTLYTGYPVCNTTEKMRESLFHGLKLTHEHPHPCQEMPNIALNYGFDHAEEHFGHDIPIYVSYPDKWKIVTQSQLVDIHALIGNVGGYIGLFLGEMLYILILFQSKKHKTHLSSLFIKNLLIFCRLCHHSNTRVVAVPI